MPASNWRRLSPNLHWSAPSRTASPEAKGIHVLGAGVIRLGSERAVGERFRSLEMSMTRNKARKRLVRARATKTGESFTAAHRHVLSSKEKDMNTSTKEHQTCNICQATSVAEPTRSFVVSDAVAICSSCANRVGFLAAKAAAGEVVMMMGPQEHQDASAATAWAAKSGSGVAFDLVQSWKQAWGSDASISPDQLGELISLWKAAGSPTDATA